MARTMLAYAPSQSVLTEVDASDPARSRVVRTLTLDGSYLRPAWSAARCASSPPLRCPRRCRSSSRRPPHPTRSRRRAHNRTVLASSHVGSWLPSYRIKRAGHAASKPHALVQCRNIRRPVGFSGPRPADGDDRRPGEGARSRRLDRDHDRRPHRLCVAERPLRRDRALGRPARRGDADERAPEQRHAPPFTPSTSRARRRPSTSGRLRARAICSASGRCRSSAASSASSAPTRRPGGARAPATPSRS